MSYAMSLLQLEKKVYSNPEYVAIIEKAQQLAFINSSK